MAKKYANAYRVVSRDTVSAYETGDFSAVPNLDGAFMKQNFESMNKNQYLDDVKYLHFFKHMGDARDYLEELQEAAPGVEFCVLEFNFDEAMLRRLAGKGFYFNKAYRKQVEITEYVVPVEVYDAKTNFLGEVAPGELENSYGTFIEDTYY